MTWHERHLVVNVNNNCSTGSTVFVFIRQAVASGSQLWTAPWNWLEHMTPAH
jgi:hypothetical protein